MNEKIEHGLISRRTAFSLFGVTAAFSLATPITLSALSEAQAQTPGMERREDRRDDRQERREDRRDDRQQRRDDRQEGRQERRDDRRGGENTTGTSGTPDNK
jgi:hypothetical protein